MHPDHVSGTLFCHLCARLRSASTTSVTSLKCITSYHTTVPGYVLQVPQVLLLWSVSHPITLLCQAMFCKYHKCYFSEVYHILSHYCARLCSASTTSVTSLKCITSYHTTVLGNTVLSLVCQAMFCKCHKCYFSEVYHIVSHYCSQEHCFVTCVPGYVLQVPQVLLLWSVPHPITLLFSGTLFCHLCARLCSASTTSVTSLRCITTYHTTVLRNTVLSLVCQAMSCKYHKCYFSEVYHILCSASTTSVTSLKCITSYHTTVAAFSMPTNCLNQSNSFCYVCGEVTFKFQRKI